MDEDTEPHVLCVPEVRFTGKLREMLERLLGEWQFVTYVINGFTMNFYQVPMAPDFEKLLEQQVDLSVGRLKDLPKVLVASEGPSIVVEENGHPLFSDDGKATLRRIEATLGSMSQCCGYEIHLHASERSFVVPKRAGRKEIHIILSAAPPGSTEYILRDEHPETKVSFIALSVAQTRCKGPAPGRGHVVNAKDGKPIAQIIGRNFYLFIPADRTTMDLLPVEEGVGLFEYALRLAWNAYIAGPTSPEEKPIRDQNDLKAYLAAIGAIRPADVVAKILALEDEIEELRASYQRKINRLRMVNAISVDSLQQTRRMLESIDEWQPVLSHPLLVRMSVVAGALHVVTKPLAYEGHAVGAYVVRFDCDPLAERWRVTIYCADESLHPKSIPHPHVGGDGAVCFGNVGLIIDQALVEQRIPDAVLLCLNWLADGYDETVARYKIAEWPRIETPSQVKEVA